MIRSIRVAAVQLRAHDRRDFARALDEIVGAAREASTGAELVVLPEATFPAYVLGDNSPADDAAIDAAIARLSALARETSTVIVAGVALRTGGALHNAALAIDRDGNIAGRAHKLFLWHFDRRWFEPGETLAPVGTAIGRLGMLICADGRIPTIARTLVDRGAELLVMPTAWVTTGRNPGVLENVQADLLARVRAFENGVPFVAANKCGAELGMVAYCGKSQIVDANGNVVAIGSETQPEIVKAVIASGHTVARRAKIAAFTPRAAPERPVRLAISIDALPADVDRRLELIDAAFAIAPGDKTRLATLDRAVATANVGDADVLDPGVLPAFRRAGYRLALWTAESTEGEWIERLARARALELRMYVVVFDVRANRAYAVDPDGIVVAGTFGDFRLASFSLDPRKTSETMVAPGTDIAEGLERVASIVIREEREHTMHEPV